MQSLLFVTGNQTKFQSAATICQKLGVELKQTLLDIPEIQDKDGHNVARDKAQKAFTALQKPVVISDDTWMIPGLNNFPGPFMKFMNSWLSADDWLRLTGPLKNRRIILRQIAVYQDATEQKLFYIDVEGILLEQARGNQPDNHSMALVSFDGGKTSVAEAMADNGSALASASRTTWHDLCQWLLAKQV